MHRPRRGARVLGALAAVALAVGCGCASQSTYAEAGAYYHEAPPAQPAPVYEDVYYGFDAVELDGEYASADDAPVYVGESVALSSEGRGGLFRGGSGRERSSRSERQVAQAEPATPSGSTASPVPNVPTEPAEGPAPERVAPEEQRRQGPLLIYTGSVNLAVYQVEQKQEEALAIIEELGGYASSRGRQHLVMRVPAEHFREALDRIAELGDVLDMSWQSEDIGEQYRDLSIRLRNSLEMRERLAALLEQATTVEEALAIEAQLERVTLEIEQMRGRLRYLEDQIAYSTITLRFSQLHISQVPGDEYRLPFTWLNQLGLERLLSL